MIKLNLKNVLMLLVVILVSSLLLAGCNQADSHESMVANSLEEATGMEWEIYEMEIIIGKECDANSYFQPDTGMEVLVFKYSDTYADVQINYGAVEDEEMLDTVIEVMEGIYNMDIMKYDFDLGGF